MRWDSEDEYTHIVESVKNGEFALMNIRVTTDKETGKRHVVRYTETYVQRLASRPITKKK